MKLAIYVKKPALRADDRFRTLCSALEADGHTLYDIETHEDLRAGRTCC